MAKYQRGRCRFCSLKSVKYVYRCLKLLRRQVRNCVHNRKLKIFKMKKIPISHARPLTLRFFHSHLSCGAVIAARLGRSLADDVNLMFCGDVFVHVLISHCKLTHRKHVFLFIYTALI